MPTTAFTDNKGREWFADFTTSAIKRVRDRRGIDLANLATNEFQGYKDAAGDPVKLAEVLYTMCHAQNPGVTEDDFLDSLAGEALHAAAEAFQEGFLLFCPSHLRTAIRTLVATSQEATEKAILAITDAATNPAPSSTTATDSPA